MFDGNLILEDLLPFSSAGGASVTIETHIPNVCCCAPCSEGQSEADVAFDMNFDAGAMGTYYQSQNNKPSFTWDQAAEQISRWNAKWDDEDAEGGVAGNAIGTPGTVTFGFSSNPSDSTARAMTVEEIARTLEAINEFEEITNLTFIRVQDEGSEYIADNASAEMDFQAEEGTNGGYATPFWQNGTLQSSTVHIGVSGNTDYGSWSYKTTIHEIGHAVGLPHPGDYNGAGAGGYADEAEYAEDTYMYTVMSYFSHAFTGGDTFESVSGPNGETASIGGYATGLLLHDIAALQRLYGVNMETRTGDTVYGFNSTEDASSHWNLSDWKDYFVASIWDAGGNDTIDASGYYEDGVISLVEESFSSLGGLTYNLSIARGAVIENAIGGFGNDRLIGNAEDNTLNGGDGLDTVDFSAATAGINFDLSAASFSAVGLGTDTLISIEGVVGTEFDDVLTGTDEDNFFAFLGGDDTITGGLGTDWISLEGATGGVTIDANTLSAGTLTADGLGTNTFTSIEGIEGTQFTDTFAGDDGMQLYRGGAGDDTFIVSAGGDSYDGGDGLDTIDFRASTSQVEIHLGTGTVFNSGSFGNFTQSNFEHVHMTEFNDWINATGDDNIINTYGGNDTIYSQQGDDTVNAGDGDDFISAWYGDDTVFAGAGNDTIEGGYGRDTIFGEAGDDTIDAGNNDDVISGGAGADIINGGSGIDVATYATSSQGVVVDLAGTGSGGDAEGDTFSNVENLIGSAFEDTLIGDGNGNTLSGGDGNDILDGKGGSDQYFGGNGNDTVSYASAAAGVTVNLVSGGQGSDAEGDTYNGIEAVIGSDFDDTLIGDSGDNTLNGGGGNDTFRVLEGNNTLTGGTGSDTFIFSDTAAAFSDTITDFNVAEDVIDFSEFASNDDAEAAFNSAVADNGNTVITLPGGGTLTLVGVSVGDLSISNFRFPNSGSDGILGDDDDNVLNGTTENDTINGQGGNDLISGLGGSDVLNGGDGNDILIADAAPAITTSEGFVYRIYLATLDREPDAGGLRFWTDRIDTGESTNLEVVAGFVGSAEFQSTYGDLDDEAFVELLYNNVLGRSSDPAGLQSWLDLLSSGSSRADVVVGFSESAEFIGNTEYPAIGYFSNLTEANLGAVYRAYGAVLDRNPDPAGFEFWVDILDRNEQSLQQVIDGFTGSTEFQQRYGSLDDEAFVTLLYNNVLNRNPDAAGLQSWLDNLNNGMSRAEVVLGFSQSAEYISSSNDGLEAFINVIYADRADTLDGDSQSDILFGGRGADTFIFDANEVGSDTVYGLEQFDNLVFDNFGYSSSSDALAFMVESGGRVVFSDQGVTVTFAGATMAELQLILQQPQLSPGSTDPEPRDEVIEQPDALSFTAYFNDKTGHMEFLAGEDWLA